MLLLVAGAVVAAMVVVTGLASTQGTSEISPSCEQGIINAFTSPGAKHRSEEKAQEKLDTNSITKCGGKI